MKKIMENIMDKKKKTLVLGVSSIFILLISLAFAIINGVQPVDLWGKAQPIIFFTHILDFFFIAFIGFGLMCAILGFAKKSTWFIFVATLLISLSLIYLFLHFAVWLLIFVVLFVFVAIMIILSLMVCGNKTEKALNNEPEYKNYEQRRQEKLEKEQSQPKEDHPEI